MAQLVLTTTREPEPAQEALALLAHTGQKKAAKAAASRLWIGGPLEALRQVSSRFAEEPWSRRSEGAGMAIFAHGGDLLKNRGLAYVAPVRVPLQNQLGPLQQTGLGLALTA